MMLTGVDEAVRRWADPPAPRYGRPSDGGDWAECERRWADCGRGGPEPADAEPDADGPSGDGTETVGGRCGV